MLKRTCIPIVIVTLSTLALYWLVASRLLLDPPITDPATTSTEQTMDASKAGPAGVTIKPNPAAVQSSTTAGISQHTGTRTIEIFGRVRDVDLRPIDDVFITEERYFFNTRSDAQGNYRLMLELPRHRQPTLRFLRQGFAGKQIRLDKTGLQQKTRYQLDPVLEENPESVKLSGWVGNEIGVALKGARVDLAALQRPAGEDFSLTVFTDSGGNFSLEGVQANESYRLSINLAPEYAVYRDPDLRIGLDPPQLSILLQSLRFVDIDGMILNRDSSPVSDFEIYISNVTTGVHSRKILSDSSGFFSLKQFPLGEVSLSTRGSDIYEISGLILTDSEYRNLELVIDRSERYLSGRVRDENGVVPRRAMVTIDQTFFDGPIRYHQYRSQATGTDGHFSFDKLGQGEYRITVYAPGYHKQELVHRIVNQSDEVEVTLRQLEN